MPSSKTRIAIIGGGAAGLIAARHIAALDTYSLILFEQTDQIGGTWVYTDETNLDKHGLAIHSSMYKNLRRFGTNFWPEFLVLHKWQSFSHIHNHHPYHNPIKQLGLKDPIELDKTKPIQFYRVFSL